MPVRGLAKIARMAKLQISVTDNGSKALVTFPSLSVDDIDRTGNINVRRVEVLLIAGRMAAHHIKNPQTGDTFLDYDKLTAQNLTFVASGKTNVMRELYRLVDLPELPILDVELELGFRGKSSFSSIAVLKNRENGQALAKNVIQIVNADRVKRRATEIPDWWKEKYASVITTANERLIIRPLQVPDHGFHKYQMQVVWADTDSYLHTSYSSYISFCLDAAMDAVVKNHFTKFHADILNYHIKEMQVSYTRESNPGDVLEVKTWEDESDPFQLYFDVSRKGKTIFQSSMLYHEQ